jgi:hypothetical protein
LILLIVNLIPAYFSDDLSRLKYDDSFVWDRKIRLLREGGLNHYDTLIIGDSQSQSGILPDLLSSNGEAVYNLSLPAMQPEGLESLIHLIDTHAPGVKRILVNISPYNAFSSDVYQGFLNYYRTELMVYDPAAPFRGGISLAGKSAGDYLERLLVYLPLYALHDTLYPASSFGGNLSDYPFSSLRRNPDLIPGTRYSSFLLNYSGPETGMLHRIEENQKIADLMDLYRGYWIWKSLRDPQQGCVDGETTGIGGYFEFRDRRGSQESWHRVLKSLAKTGREVLLIQIPLSPFWEKTTDPRTVYSRLDRLIEEASRGLNVRVFPRPDVGDYRGLFNDWTHLNYCGAKKYTLWLRNRIGNRL